jgi:predicted short-subunit dehydrogenase-like oxidoreductase (DUF2520 family)
MPVYNISFLGAGRVAGALSLELMNKGHIIKQIVSPGKVNGQVLAKLSGATWSAKPEFSENTDIIFAAIPDRELQAALRNLKCNSKTIVAHTAGSFGLEVFPESSFRKGVFYPLQTFSKGRKINFAEVPVFTEASDEETGKVLDTLASSLGCRVYRTDKNQRTMLHAAAVFVSNFTNHMLTAGKDISSKAGFNFDILVPLIREAIDKAIENGPEKSQTGPAIRHDRNTIEKHLELLSYSPELKSVYGEVTRAITEYYKELRPDE